MPILCKNKRVNVSILNTYTCTYRQIKGAKSMYLMNESHERKYTL